MMPIHAIPHRLPSDAAVAAALEQLITEAQHQLDTTPTADREERAFWRRQRNAFVNAQADWALGRRPIPQGAGYCVPSASRPSAFHRCTLVGGIWTCSCEAGEQGVFHRHTALITAIEVAAEIEQAEGVTLGGVPLALYAAEIGAEELAW